MARASGRAVRLAFGAAALLLEGMLPLRLAAAQETCLECHGEKDLATERGGRVLSLYVDRGAFGRSVHSDVVCGDCHAGLDPAEVPHAARIRPVDCRACHEDIAATHPFHAALASPDARGPGVSCKVCHGTHEITSPKTPGGKFHFDRQAADCGACHANAAEAFALSEHGRALQAGAAVAPSCMTCHRHPITHARAEGQTVLQKIAQEKVCLSCHLDNAEVRARMGPGPGFIAAYEMSVHGRALLGGEVSAANCVDCHGSHEMRKGFDPTSRVNRRHIPETCGACHSAIAEQYGRSVHGAAARRGVEEAPVCTDCHGEHTILSPRDPRSPVAPANLSAQVCAPCHDSLRLSSKFEMPGDRYRSFADSFHGLALRGGSLAVAHCASCHGAHDILPSRDPGSKVNKARLAETCGRCHPGASERFAAGNVHVLVPDRGEPLLYWIATAYVVLITVVVGGMFVHNLLDFVRKALRRFRIRRTGEAPSTPGHALYVRMTTSERLQHGTLALSFLVLVVTGFMLQYPDAAWVAALRRLDDRLFDLRSLLHRVAAVVMVAASLFHIGYLSLTARGREFLRDIAPRPSDLGDALGVLRYNLGLSRSKPRFGRFSYIEKSEYWALVWGTILMTATGVVLWFEGTFIGLLTKLGWDVARTVHYYEAWLATLAIVVWHFYYVIFNPDVYPMSLAWLTGTITEGEMVEEHPQELEAIRRRERQEEERRARTIDASRTARDSSRTPGS